MNFQSLLPQNATPLEVTLEQAASRAYSMDMAIEALDNPDLMPDQFVAFQAWGWSTDLWDKSWPIERKRAVLKAWWRLHRSKGTLAGIEEAVRFFDARVVAVRRPPDAIYPDPALSKTERDAYLARFQQLRLYDYRGRGVAGFGAYLSSAYRLSRLFVGGKAFPAQSDAVVRVGRRAFIYDPLTGTEQPVRRVTRTLTTETRKAARVDQILIPGSAGFATFLGMRPKVKLFTADSGASGRSYTVQVDVEYSERTSSLHVSGIVPSLSPISVMPRREQVQGSRGVGQLFPGSRGSHEFIGRKTDGMRRAFLPPSSAGLRIYDVLFLYDPKRVPDRRSARTFLGNTRLGMPAYNARITLETRGIQSPYAVRRFVSGFLLTSDKSRLTKAIGAIRQEKSLRDKILVTAKTMRPATVRDGFKLGTINVGTWVRDL